MHRSESHEPLFHIVRRDHVTLKHSVAVRAAAVILALLVCAVVFFLLTGKSPLQFYSAMIHRTQTVLDR